MRKQRVPFGGFESNGYSLNVNGEVVEDPKAWIDEHSDPAPLLEEIAGCALEGRPMRPLVAAWFYDAWKEGRIHIDLPKGGKRADRRKWAEAVMRMAEFDGEPDVEKKMAALKEELGLSVTVKAMHGWRREYRAVQKALFEAREKEQREVAIAEFRRLRRRGLFGGEVLAHVRTSLDVDFTPSDDLLREWQSLAAAASGDPEREG